MAVGADILIVTATLLSGVSIASIVSGWVSRAWPVIGLTGLATGVGLFVYVWQATGGLAWTDVPDAFILVAARLLN